MNTLKAVAKKTNLLNPESVKTYLASTNITYKGRVLKWDIVIEHKANELGRFLTGKGGPLDFVEPEQQRKDSGELRAKILALTQSQA